MDDNKNIQAVLVALLALASAFLGVTTYRDSLSSHRPPSALQGLTTGPGDEDVLARLWEDPITAVDGAAKEHRDANHGITRLADRVQNTAPVRILAVMVEGSPFTEDVEVRLRLRYALAAALMIEGFEPEDRTSLGFVQVPWSRGVSEGRPFRFSEPPTARHVAGPFLLRPPGVESEFLESLRMLDDLLGSRGLSGAKTTRLETEGGGEALLVPYEWWSRSDGKDHLVLWLREEEFADDPLWRLGELLRQLLTRRHARHADIALIGPRSSNTLQRMARPEVQGLQEPHLPVREMRIISPSAPEVTLARRAGMRPGSHIGSKIEANARRIFGQPQPESSGTTGSGAVHWTNVVIPDEELALALVDELKRRGIEIRRKSSPHRIVLISEADTVYGRALPRAFTAAAMERRKSRRDDTLTAIRRILVKREFPKASNISHYSYLRGLDGRTARISARKNKDEEGSSSAEDAIRRSMSPTGQAAEGEIQFDYLERLATELQRKDRDWARGSRPFDRAGIRAIGILGTDPYDKLVILQAMRPHFPEAVFFTTDLDGRLWDGPSLRLTHNLVVASPFDPFNPDHGVAGRSGAKFAPLRDSAQAGLFHAVRLAVAPSGLPSSSPRPLLYEIGRKRPVELEPENGDSIPVALTGPLGSLQLLGLLLIVAGSGSLWLLWRHQESKPLVPRAGDSPAVPTVDQAIAHLQARTGAFKLWYGIFTALMLLASMALIWWLGKQPGGEPLELGEGVSVWPTEWIRLAVVLLVGGLLWWAWLRHLAYRLTAWRDYFAPDQTGVPDFGAREAPCTVAPPDWVSAEMLFRRYLQEAQFRRRALRTVGAGLLYVAFGVGIFFAWGSPVRPIRGDAAWRIDLGCLWAAILAFTFLTFYVVDTTLVTRRLLKGLAEKRTAWPNRVIRREANALGLNEVPDAPTGPGPSLGEALEGLIDVRYASEHTQDLGGRFYLPFFVMLLMIVSRSRLFDNWGWPLSMILMNVCSLSLVLACAFLARQAARRVREAALTNLAPYIVAAEGRGDGSTGRPNLADLKNIRDAIGKVGCGAYSELRSDPAVLSVLIPTGGYGLFVLICQLVLGMH